MEMLSLQEPPESPARGLNRAEAFLVSIGVHLVLLLLVFVVPDWLPESVRTFFAPRPAITRPPIATTAPAVPAPAKPPDPAARIPLKFAYVKVPDDTPTPKNPRAPLLSDKNRRARQEVPTPPDAKRFSIDPHSRGDSIDRVRPDPNLPAGVDTPRDAPAPPVRAGAPAGGPGESGLLEGGRPIAGDLTSMIPPVPESNGDAARPPESRDDVASGQRDPRERSGGGVIEKARAEARSVQPDGRKEGRGTEPRGGFRDALTEWQPGEFKFTYNNPAYLRGGSHGTLSFETQDFPWGDYARQIYVRIRNNWLARIPLAAREGIRGFACWKFAIRKDGGVGGLDLVRTSAVPPFERAAADAIRASDPLPPLPEEFPRDSEGVTFCFYYNLLPGEME